MRTLGPFTLALLILPLTLDAQETDYRARYQAEADGLRGRVECPTDVAWPPLPTEEHRTFRTATFDSAGALLGYPSAEDSAKLARSDVVVPQYAFYYYKGPRGPEQCIPVFIVQAEGHSFGWLPVRRPAPAAAGAAVDVFFDLLGAEPPQGPELREDGI